MFLRRKGRRREEDPLVPHGLVWHAMAESADRDQKAAATSEVNTPKVIAMPPQPVRRETAAGVPDVTRKKPAKGVPPFWHSLSPARAGAVETGEGREATTAPPAPVPIRNESIPIREAALVPIRNENVPIRKATPPERKSSPAAQKARKLLAARLRQMRLQIVERLRQAKDHAKQAEVLAISALGRVQELFRGAGRSLKTGFSRLDPLGALKDLGHALNDLGHVLKDLGHALKDFGQKPATAIRDQSRRLVAAIHIPQKPTWNFQIGAIFSPVVRRVRAFSWRPPIISVKAFATELEILSTREIAKWKLRRPDLTLSRNLVSRVLPLTWPALLIVGLIFSVRHYATQALPSHMRPTTPAEYGPAQVSARPRRYQAKAPQPVKGKVASSGKRQPSSEAGRNRRGQPRDEVEGNYVAPDTYVYYGQKGKNAR